MTIKLTDQLLRDMFELCSFPVPADELAFVALRGVQPLEYGGTAFAATHDLLPRPVDYVHMRCTIVQWDTGKRELAVFVGSSVPHMSSIMRFQPANGVGVNRLASGYFGNVPGMPDHRYVKGNHGEDRHLAFRNETRLPVWRTGDDFDFEGDDRFEFDNIVYDNLHCARQMNEAADRFSSRGCIVVAGRPGPSGATQVTSELGPWKRFLGNAYALAQRRFVLAVFEQDEALRTFELGAARRAPSVRFGSRGILVERLQAGLVAKGFGVGTTAPDGLFGGHTANALLLFQRHSFGKAGADMIAGPGTAEALGIDWPAGGAALRDSLSAPGLPARGISQPAVTASAAPDMDAVATTALTEDPTLKIALDTNVRPLPGWAIRARPADSKGRANWEVIYNGQAAPFYLGFFFDYPGYGVPHTKGLARVAGAAGGLRFEPTDWTQFGHWPELLFPTAWAESNANFTVINAWDRAAMTFGFIQLAAHTGDDFLPFFRKLFRDLPGEATQWFPELGVVDSALCFIKGGAYRSLEKKVAPWDGGYTASYYHGDLMGFFNPDRYHPTKPADPEELHAAARWLVWTLTSQAMRAVQVEASIDNLRGSVNSIHNAIMRTPAVRAKYPKGVDGMRCDLLSVAVAAPHLGDAHTRTILAALVTSDPIEAIRTSNYGPGGRSQNTHEGMLNRPVLRNLVYDLATQQPV